jgi:2-dehydropantoate 2-reductase
MEHGYRVDEMSGESWTAPSRRAPLVNLAENRERFDLAIFATQSTTLDRALTDTLPHLSSRAAVVTCQNGLPEERARHRVGDRVVGCVVGWGASMVAPGHYRRTSTGGLQLGRTSVSGPAPEPIAELLAAASETKVVPDLAGVRWSKLAINCVTTTLGAIGGAPLGRLLTHRPVRRLALEIFAEVAAVARASGVRVQPVGGTLDIDKIAITPAERTLTFGSPSLAYKHSVLLAVGFKYRRMRSSMLYALERGRPPEIDHLNGEIVRRGAALGVPTPVNSALVDELYAIVRGHSRSEIPRLRAVYDQLLSGRPKARLAA